ncbi:tyrosine-type recombinase/integrase [Xanthomonas citri pv. anacardii]|nr:integrase arm-type DNA-binding domain-containing protein [Xanthomonas citri]MCT8357797.1 tyrosine-type recombinase/integrase [Xanthomonas citri pv. anacardii]MCT8361883.1 tyrosine-type recombinase/integrase [Xanthomonas citri pv. anacardii]MCT8365796.1 tyrosine-type recombinase/integrase [Xanthomonas citri pv. anacardii]MCT8369932.1 tyrosine-type recombinase/integrase [Xanthomonas citri pv. anacardii]MCT8373891.1 tyrosine-type recombinase/integrase [Xanthomonas citri pv. anacardii]
MSLTDTALKALKPRDASYIVSDDRGLYVEVLPSGSIVWRYRYRLNGKREKLTLGKYPALTLKNARLKRDEAAHLVAMGESPAKKKQQEKVAGAEDSTLADFAERFFKDIQSRDRKNVTMPRRYLEKDILPHIGSKPVRDITAEDVRSVIWRKKEQGFDAAAGQVRGLLKRMLDYALTCGLIQANPVMALPMRHVYRAAARERALTPDEIKLFLRAMQKSNIRRQFKIAFQLILMTLVRKSELMLAQWKDVHVVKGEWHIPVENSKTGKPHIVYLSAQAQTLFKELKPLASSSDWVLPGRGTLAKPFANNALNQALKVSLQGQEIPAFTIHDLRRTASTLLHEQGWPSDVVEKALNHTIGGVRGVYNRAEYAEQRREMLQAWADYIDGLVPSANLVIGAASA